MTRTGHGLDLMRIYVMVAMRHGHGTEDGTGLHGGSVEFNGTAARKGGLGPMAIGHQCLVIATILNPTTLHVCQQCGKPKMQRAERKCRNPGVYSCSCRNASPHSCRNAPQKRQCRRGAALQPCRTEAHNHNFRTKMQQTTTELHPTLAAMANPFRPSTCWTPRSSGAASSCSSRT